MITTQSQLRRIRINEYKNDIRHIYNMNGEGGFLSALRVILRVQRKNEERKDDRVAKRHKRFSQT